MSEKIYLGLVLVLLLIAFIPNLDAIVINSVKCVWSGLRNRKGGGCG